MRSNPAIYFIGVTTAKSSIMKVFPHWMEALGRPEVTLVGIDLALHEKKENYRSTVVMIKQDPLALGALVTTHKINLLEASLDLFDYLDPYAVLCEEVSCISKNASSLEGHAKDPITAGKSLDSLLGARYFEGNSGQVLCLGAGGAGKAIVLNLAKKQNPADRPHQIVVVDCLAARLEKLAGMLAKLKVDVPVEYHCNIEPAANDCLMAKLPSGSVVINATGMGKDIPGSPISGKGAFPLNGVAWDLNYRGELDFLRQALGQVNSRKLVVKDGWLYFLHGWTEVISQVLKVSIEGALFDSLAIIAKSICNPAISALR